MEYDPRNMSEGVAVESNNSNNLSIAEILTLVKRYIRELIKFSWLIVLIGGGIAYLLYTQEKGKVVNYTATFTFTLNENTGGGLGSLLSGLPVEFSTGESQSLTRLQEMMKSRLIIQSVLLDKINIEGKEDYLGNHYLRIMRPYKPRWKEDPLLDNFRFTSDSVLGFSMKERSILKQAYGDVANSRFNVYATEGEVVTLNVTTPNELLSYFLAHKIYEKVNAFYVARSIQQQKLAYESASRRVDSLRTVVDDKERTYVQFTESHQFSTYSGIQVRQQRIASEMQAAQTAYFAAVKNEEVARFVLEQQSPAIQSLDPPLLPLGAVRPNPLRMGIIGGLVGIFLGVILIVGQRLLRDFIAKESAKQR